MYLHPFGILRNGYHADDFKSVKITVISIITAKLGEYKYRRIFRQNWQTFSI